MCKIIEYQEIFQRMNIEDDDDDLEFIKESVSTRCKKRYEVET